MYKQEFRTLSDDGLLAIYLLHRVATEGAKDIKLENAFLRKWLNVGRVYEERVTKLHKSLSHIFPGSKISTDDKERAIIILSMDSEVGFKNKRVSISDVPSLEELEQLIKVRKTTVTIG